MNSSRKSGQGQIDIIVAACVIAMVGFGVIMVYSASAFEASVRFHDAQYYVKRQAIYALLGLLTMAIVSKIDYLKLRVLTYPILAGVTALLVATIAGLGHRAGNAYRWIAIGPIHVQPSEAAKVAVILWLSYSLAKKRDRLQSFAVGFLPHMLVVGVLMLLCLKQPDFGSAVVLLTLTLGLMFIAGVRFRHIFVSGLIFSVAGIGLIRFSEYRYGRFLSWLNMAEHRQGLAYQPFQSVMSFGSGEWFGLGLGRGLQVLYLPEAHTDFIAAIIGEELGFVGVLVMVGVYGLIVRQGIKIALTAREDYGTYIAFGVSLLIALQVLLNLAVAMAIIPTKGLTLPFVSYGGSSLIVSAAAAGLLLSVSRGCRQESTAVASRARKKTKAASTRSAATLDLPLVEEAA